MSQYRYRSNTTRSNNTRRTSYGGGQRSGGGSRRRTGQYIDPARFVKVAQPVAADEYTPSHHFVDFEVNQIIKDNLTTKGFSIPTPIQDQTIMHALEGKDVIGVASTGTGKTAAFAVPLIDRLLQSQHAKALIIAPTRELAQQIEEECRSIGKGTGLFGTLLIGGSPMGPQLRDLRQKPRIVIGTPGRIKDHIEQRTLDLALFNTIVLDEVDRMLDMGFVNDVRFILNKLSDKRQSFFFSATLDSRVTSLIQTFANDPVTISVGNSQTSENVHQNVVRYESSQQKIDKLHNLLASGEVAKALVFDETQRSVERLSKELVSLGFQADSIHGGKSQGQRMRALKRFKNNEVTVLVATDVAARGLDVADITHVINFAVPQSYEDYIHRIGRAGRAGRTGYALTFVAGSN